jgi:hypothetical protein
LVFAVVVSQEARYKIKVIHEIKSMQEVYDVLLKILKRASELMVEIYDLKATNKKKYRINLMIYYN